MYGQTRLGRSQRFQSIWRRSVRTKVARDNLLQAVPQHGVLVLHTTTRFCSITQAGIAGRLAKTSYWLRQTPSPYAIAPLPSPSLQKQQTFISANLSDASKLGGCMPWSGQTDVAQSGNLVCNFGLDSQASDTESRNERIKVTLSMVNEKVIYSRFLRLNDFQM